MTKKQTQSTKNPIGQRADTMRELIIEAAKGQAVLDKTVGSISNRLLVVAKTYQEKDMIMSDPNGERVEKRADKFKAATTLEEKWIRSKEAGELQRDTLPKCWTQSKSNIKAAIELGIDLRPFNSESALRKEVVRVRGLKSASPLDAELSEFKKAIQGLHSAKALEIVKQANAAIFLALEAIRASEKKALQAKAENEQPATKAEVKKPAKKTTKARKPSMKDAKQTATNKESKVIKGGSLFDEQPIGSKAA